jgi:hypothetical protein
MAEDMRRIEVLKHTLGYNKGGRVTRNHFVAGPSHKMFDVLEGLVKDTFMVREIDPFDKERYVYHTTLAGTLHIESYLQRQRE